jgi:hypothetical protein
MKYLLMMFSFMLCLSMIASTNRVDLKKSVDLEAERKELLRLHELARVAHLEKKADLMVEDFADDFISISDGKIKRPKREETRDRLQNYFNRVKFLAWDDISAPVIKISQDGSMAYVVVHKRVHLTAPDNNGKTIEEETIFAWTATYEKRDGKWQLTSVTSTNEPRK